MTSEHNSWLLSSSPVCDNTGVETSASKAALNSLTKTISKEMGVKNLRVNAVLPGLTDTKMAKNFTKDDAIDEYLNKVALKRIAKTSEIANVIAFLASDKSSYINGQLITIDGGR